MSICIQYICALNQGYETYMEKPYSHVIKFASATLNISYCTRNFREKKIFNTCND